MSDERPQWKSRRWELQVLPLVVLAGLYVGGYLLLGSHHGGTEENTQTGESAFWNVRTFPYRAIQRAYYPLGWLEFTIRDEDLELWSEDDPDFQNVISFERFDPGIDEEWELE